MTSYFISTESILSKCILCAPMVSVRANAVSRRIVSLLGIFENFGLGAFPMQKPAWDDDSGMHLQQMKKDLEGHLSF